MTVRRQTLLLLFANALVVAVVAHQFVSKQQQWRAWQMRQRAVEDVSR